MKHLKTIFSIFGATLSAILLVISVILNQPLWAAFWLIVLFFNTIEI